MIFPQLGTTYYDEKDRGIISFMESCYAQSITTNQSFWVEADTNHRFVAGDQTVWSDYYGNLPVTRRRNYSFNHIKPIVNMISGYQRKNRKSLIVVPVENGDDTTADQFTKIFMHIDRSQSVSQTYSKACEGSLIAGMNLLQIWLDYRTDPVNGEIRVDNCSYNSFLMDPFFRRPDLSDCNYIWKRSFVTKLEAISLLPDHADEIMGMSGVDNKDGKFQFLPETYNYSMKNLISYDEFYYRDYREQKMLVDTQTGETTEWKIDDKEKLEQFLRAYPEITVIKQTIPTVRVAIIVQGKVMYDGPNPLGIDRYPFVNVFAYFEPEMPYYPWRITGIVNNLRDPQFLYNRRKAIELDILESQPNSGFIYKMNALVNPADIFMTGQGKGIALKEEAQITDIQKIPSASIDPSAFEVSRSLGDEMLKISGANEELMGSAVDDKAGILSMLRQGAGLTTLQPLFDNWDFAYKLLGELFIDIIQVNYTPGKIQRIIGEQPAPLFYKKEFGKYGAAVEEGFNTTTQKQMQFAQLLQLRELGVPVPDDVLIEAATLQDKKQLIESIQRNSQQQQQMQQAQMQSEMQEQQARIELAHARATADKGLGLERVSRVEENRALAIERLAEADKDRELATLDKVRALKELEDMDLTHLEKLLSIKRMLESPEVDTAQPKTVKTQRKDNGRSTRKTTTKTPLPS